MATKQKPKVQARVGRPPSPYQRKKTFRTSDEKLAAWRAAAATCGLPLDAWILATLDGEALVGKHVRPIAKGGRRV